MKFLSILLVAYSLISGSAYALPEDSIFYLHQDKVCKWLVFDVKNKKNKQVHSSETCPERIIWDVRNGITYYSQKGYLVIHRAEKKQIQKLIVPKKLENLTRMWLQKNGKLRFAYLHSLETREEKSDGITIIITKTKMKGKKHFVGFEGKQYDITKFMEWGWGVPYLAVVMEWQKKGWKRIAVEPTNSEAGDTLHLSVVNRYMDANKTATDLDTLKSADVCNFTDCAAKKFLKKSVLSSLKKVKKLNKGWEILAYRPLDSTNGLLFGGAQAHGMATEGPVYLCKKKCAKYTKLKIPKNTNSQLHFIRIRGPYALLKLSGAAPVLMNSSAAKAYYTFPKHAEGLIWVPKHLASHFGTNQ